MNLAALHPAVLHPNLRVRIAVGFLQRLLDSMVMSFMAIYLAFEYGVAVAGVLVVTVMVLGVVGTLAGGHMSDARGRRRTLLLGETGVCVTFALMAVADSPAWHSPALVYCGYLVNKFAASFAMPANDAMILDVTTPESRKLVYTINYWSINLALAFGALLGGFLYNGHFTLLLTLAAAGTVAIAAATYFLIAETKPEETEQGLGETGATAGPRGSILRDFANGYRLVLQDRAFGRLLVAATLFMSIELQLINYIGVRLARDLPAQNLLSIGSWSIRVDGVEMLGILRAENTVLVVALALVAHLVLRRVPDRVRMYAGAGLFTAGYMVLAVSDTGWVLLVAALVLTVGELMDVPVRQALLADMVPAASRTRYMAVYNLNIRVALVVASLCITVGSVLPPWGMAALYGVFGLVIIWQYHAILTPSAARAELARA
ncbi:MFS transporter, DHA1 family, multidrug resistance protein B [Microbispora rosea]|uniref:MFS transporter, DHA1 family, multidrug resistance protein B n=1 Tax=Microbispora rosea TaxID=58117 RepID=A0A1N7HGS5_9ACTN|nr:MFS transporter [Microbispora rosea subsp. rosea]SIS24002.1 MFS transporter, DHA1 family, multidrug resistance protein B [Microbispora rosea]